MSIVTRKLALVNYTKEMDFANDCRTFFLNRESYINLFVLRLNVLVNNFSVMSGRSQRFLGLTSTVGSECVLLKDTAVPPVNPGPLDSESDALPLRHRTPYLT